jgi:DNA (cytosine-5)-methyltransferase 1
MTVTFGSLFDGIGCFSLGLQRAGMSPSWLVEIENDCRRVTAKHFADVPQYADIRHCGKHNLAKVDVIVGGFPCQDLSVAGKRRGLSAERSGLFYEMVRVVDELRPAFLVWENVPGLLSSNRGRDFLSVLVSLDRIGFGGAWTVLDARYFGVPQRRRRLFGVFTRLDSPARRAAEILSFATRRAWNPAKGCEARSNVAATIRSRSHRPGVNPPGRGGEDDNNLVFRELGEGHQAYQEAKVAAGIRTGSGGGKLANLVVSPTICGRYGKGTDSDATDTLVVTHALSSEGADASEDGTERGTPLVMQCHGNNVGPMGTLREGNGGLTGGMPFIVNSAESCATQSHAREADVARALDTTGEFAASQGEAVVAFKESQSATREDDVHATLDANKGSRRMEGVRLGMIVRRLTPRECLRLQGLPDDWLDLDPPLSDSAKYRQIGNGGAVPVMEWIGRRILKFI